MVSLVKSNWRVVAGYLAHYRAVDNWVARKKALHLDTAVAQAMGYVWGWQDGGAATPPLPAGEIDASWAFGYAFGVVEAEYLAELRYSKPSIRSAWEQWSRGDAIK